MSWRGGDRVVVCLYVMAFFVLFSNKSACAPGAAKGLFRKTVVDLGLDKIQSISYEVPGILGGMFGYGTLLLQTQVGNMRISMVRKPEKIYNVLQDLVEKVAR